MPVYKWSTTAATNATADSTINWAEGQAPSSVNDSARAMMAAVAKWRSDIGFTILTGGTSTAYTVTSNSVFDSFANMDGQRLTIRFHTTNGASPTLNVDGLGAKAINYNTSTAIGAGDVGGTNSVADLVYDNGNSIWRLLAGTQLIDSGTLMLFQQTTAPTGFTKQTTHNDKTLRVVSGTASSGGSTAFSTVMAARTLTQSNLPDVTLTYSGSVTSTSNQKVVQSGAGTVAFTATGGNTVYQSASFETSSVSGNYSGSTSSINGGVGQTTVDFAVQYVDLIIAAKN